MFVAVYAQIRGNICVVQIKLNVRNKQYLASTSTNNQQTISPMYAIYRLHVYIYIHNRQFIPPCILLACTWRMLCSLQKAVRCTIRILPSSFGNVCFIFNDLILLLHSLQIHYICVMQLATCISKREVCPIIDHIVCYSGCCSRARV